MHVSFIKKAIPECTATCSVNLSKIVDKARELFYYYNAYIHYHWGRKDFVNVFELKCYAYHLFGQKYNANSNIVKYYYISK